MIQWVLDTDVLTLYQREDPAVIQRCASCAPGTLAITIISVEEQFSGWYTRLRRAKDPDELANVYERFTRFVAFVSRVQVLSFTKAAIQRYNGLRALKLNLRKRDLRIAAIALEQRITLVTRNLRDFQRVPGLQIETW